MPPTARTLGKRSPTHGKSVEDIAGLSLKFSEQQQQNQRRFVNPLLDRQSLMTRSSPNLHQLTEDVSRSNADFGRAKVSSARTSVNVSGRGAGGGSSYGIKRSQALGGIVSGAERGSAVEQISWTKSKSGSRSVSEVEGIFPPEETDALAAGDAGDKGDAFEEAMEPSAADLVLSRLRKCEPSITSMKHRV